MKKPFGILFQGWGLLTGSTLFFLGAIASPSFAQVILVEENFKNPSLNSVYAPNWRFGRGNTTSDPPCLTAAPQVAPPATSSGNGFIPGCPTDTTNTGGVDATGNGTLRLTPSKQEQASFVLYNQEIASDQGLEITFDFYIYYDDDPVDGIRRGADGLSFFLIDGNVNPTQAGAFGAALGYAQRSGLAPDAPGIEGGYVGIGFDEFGNFSVGAPAGFPSPLTGLVGGKDNRIRNQVAIRGAGSGPTGYEYLLGTRDIANLPGSLDFPDLTKRPVQQRTAKIILTPDNQISVEIDFGGGFVEIIPPYDLATAPNQPPIPPTFKFGFGSSTGFRQSIHEIQNLKVTTLAPDLRITKTPVNAEFAAGLNEYTLTVANSPSAGRPTSTITVTDTLPPGFAFRSAVGTNWTCAAVGQQVTCTYAETAPKPNPGATLPPITLQVNVTAPPGTYTNTATITTQGDTDPDNDTDEVDTTVLGTPRVGVAKQAGTIINNGDGTYIIPYTMTVRNYGNLPIQNLQIIESLLATFGNSPFIVVENSLTSNTLTVNQNFDGNGDTNLLVGTDALAVGASANIQFQVIVTPGNNLGPYNNQATAQGTGSNGTPISDISTNGTDPDPDNDTDSTNNTTPTGVTFGEIPLIGVAKAAGTPTDNGDRTFTIPYTLIVRNYGDVPLTTLQVTENLNETFANTPYTLEPNSFTSPTLTVNPNFNGNTDTNLLATGNTLAVGTEATISFRVRVTPGNNLGPFNNQVTASGVTPGGNVVNDLSTTGSNPDANNTGDPRTTNQVTSVTLRGNPNLELQKRITRINGTVVGQSDTLPNWPTNLVRGITNPNTIQPGDEVEYTIYFRSAGTAPLQNAVVCDPLQNYQTFRTDTFNGQTPTEGTFGAEVGIALALNPPNPDLPTAYLRSANSASNRGRFYPSGITAPPVCRLPNVRGAVVVDLGNLAAGDYGFIRFRVRID
ncbi:hypothetical protein [Laspinema olomoucense]|uniref:hypothetical protein n=1 Tax=Laspinema olomoucense TaxID=3231600 RepID=UPI0021BB25E8|nr:hypothetical protein [Laspinema sp. D3a]